MEGDGMTQILLHKQKLTELQVAKLEAQGVIAIRTNDPEGFKFLDLSVPQIKLNDMVWACLDAANTDNSYTSDVRRRLVQNLATLAKEQRTKNAPAESPEEIEATA
jgi:hypothetical protein